VCADDYRSSQQMLPVLLQAIHYAKEFLAGDSMIYKLAAT